MYEKAIVSFIDILGFKELVEKSTPEFVKTVLDLVCYFTTTETDNENSSFNTMAESIIFSDSVVRIRKTEKEPNITNPLGLVFYEIIDLLHAQGELLNKEILIRGGIAYGDIYFDKNQVYGPALNHAYELESQYASNPKIILSPNLIDEVKSNKLLKSESHTFEQELKYISKLISQGDDGLWFIDYILAFANELDDPDMFPVYLLKHKKIICERSKKYQKMNRVLAKFLWMAKYHNDSIRKLHNDCFLNYGVDKHKFIITPKEMVLLQNL